MAGVYPRLAMAVVVEKEKPLLAQPKAYKARLSINYLVATRKAD